MSDAPLRIVQISDIHLYGNKEKALLGVKTQESFDALIQQLKLDKKPPDLILLTGDLSQDGSEASYTYIANTMKTFPIPVYYVPGNHDNAQVMTHVYPRENITHHKHIVLAHWHIILLNSQKPGAVEGYLDRTELSFLQHCLQMYPEHYAIIAFHHHPILVGSTWLDKLGLINADDLWAILAHFPKVHSILFGHVHQEHTGKKNHINYFSAPSTCIQFKPNSPTFALDNLPPAYRWIELHPNGKLDTGIKRIPKYIGEFDANAKGY
ncbi:MAG: hypothetical protein ACD_45C00717G0002 [uncultured bacterium]|nr:MAG: hypothetical protein ACD_45C00717G0002 [uncultured bacterium]